MSRTRVTWTAAARRQLVASIHAASQKFPPRGADESIHLHDARKELKKSASVARFFAPLVGPSAYAVIEAVDAARRRVAAARDLEVLPDALAWLDVSSGAREALTRAIAVEHGRLRASPAEVELSRFREILAEAAANAQAWPLEDDSSALLASLKATYRSGLKLGRRAFSNEDADDLHDLRGRVIDLYHQSELFQAAWPAMFSAYLSELHRLRTALGDHNDLTMLGEFALSRRELADGVADEIVDRILKARRPIERRARQQFDRLYAERSGAFARRIGAYLAHPRKRRA